jgi:hypothetical protein
VVADDRALVRPSGPVTGGPGSRRRMAPVRRPSFHAVPLHRRGALVHTGAMREGLIAVAVLAVLMLGGRSVLRRSRRSVVPGRVPWAGGPLVIRAPRRNAIMLGITALVPTALMGALTVIWWGRGSTGDVGLLLGFVATALVLAFAAYQFAYAFRARLVVHDTGIERIGVSRRRLVGWGSIAKIAFNPAQHWFFVTVSDGSHLWLPADVTGMPEFAQIALRRMSPAVLSQADPVVREVLDELASAGREHPPRDAS